MDPETRRDLTRHNLLRFSHRIRKPSTVKSDSWPKQSDERERDREGDAFLWLQGERSAHRRGDDPRGDVRDGLSLRQLQLADTVCWSPGQPQLELAHGTFLWIDELALLHDLSEFPFFFVFSDGCVLGSAWVWIVQNRPCYSLRMFDLRMVVFLLQVLNVNWFQKHQDGNDEVCIIGDCFSAKCGL